MTIKHDDDVIRDGQTGRVPIMTMDSAHRALQLRIDDNFAPAMQGHRPGYALISDAARDERIERQRAHDAELSARWRSGLPATETPTAQTLATARARREDRLKTHGGRDED